MSSSSSSTTTCIRKREKIIDGKIGLKNCRVLTLLQNPAALAKSICLMEASGKGGRDQNLVSPTEHCKFGEQKATSGGPDCLEVVGVVILVVVPLRVVLEGA